MSKSKRGVLKSTKRPRGPRGRTGKAGPAGPPGADSSADVALLIDQVAALARELRTQLIRIGQLQVQLDLLAGRHERGRRSRRAGDRLDE